MPEMKFSAEEWAFHSKNDEIVQKQLAETKAELRAFAEKHVEPDAAELAQLLLVVARHAVANLPPHECKTWQQDAGLGRTPLDALAEAAIALEKNPQITGYRDAALTFRRFVDRVVEIDGSRVELKAQQEARDAATNAPDSPFAMVKCEWCGSKMTFRRESAAGDFARHRTGCPRRPANVEAAAVDPRVAVPEIAGVKPPA